MVIIVVVSDLYKMNFNPVAQKSDFKYLKNNNFFKYPIEQEHSYKNNILSKEIKSELSKLLWADIIIFPFMVVECSCNIKRMV